MARAEMGKPTLLGLFFCVPLGYTLLARLLHGDADQLAVNADKELRLGKPLQPVGHLFVGQRRKAIIPLQDRIQLNKKIPVQTRIIVNPVKRQIRQHS